MAAKRCLKGRQWKELSSLSSPLSCTRRNGTKVRLTERPASIDFEGLSIGR